MKSIKKQPKKLERRKKSISKNETTKLQVWQKRPLQMHRKYINLKAKRNLYYVISTQKKIKQALENN